MKALLLISHGSKSAKATDEVVCLARTLKAKMSSNYGIVEHAFLDVEKPSIPEGIEACVRRGAAEIIVLPHFLVSGNHVLKDIPAHIESAKAKYPAVRFFVAPFLGSHEAIADLLIHLAGKAS